MKTKSILFLLFFSIIAIANAQNYSNEKVLPAWAKEKSDDKWVGVAPPTSEMNKGRFVALVNATLSYLRSHQSGQMKSVAEVNHSNDVSDDNIEDFREYKETSQVLYSGFSCNVTNEYYNKRGEYFVECRFVSDETNAQNKLIIRKTQNSQTKDASTSKTIEVNLILALNGEIHSCKLTCNTKNDEEPVFQLLADNTPFELTNKLKYEKVQWNSENYERALVIGGNDLGQSLGIAQMVVHSLLPFVPFSINCVNSNELMEITEAGSHTNHWEYISKFSTESYSLPIKISPLSLSDKEYVLKVHDINMDNVKFKQFESDCYNPENQTALINIAGICDKEKAGAYQRLFQMGDDLLFAYGKAAQRLLEEKQSSGEITTNPEKNYNHISDSFSADGKSSKLTSLSKLTFEICNIGVHWDFGNIDWEKINKKMIRQKTWKENADSNGEDIRGLWIKAESGKN